MSKHFGMVALTFLSILAFCNPYQNNAIFAEDKKPTPAAEISPTPQASPIKEKAPSDPTQNIQEQLLKEFDEYLKNPKDYQKKMQAQCKAFPEGNLFPYIYPALGYVNMALKYPDKKEHCVKQAQKLLDLAVESVSKQLNPPGGKLENLSDYKAQAVYLGQLNLALGAYTLVSSDKRYDVLHTKLSDILHQALEKSDGRQLASYPYLTWTFDTMPVIVSLKLHDLKSGKDRSDKIIQKHLAWLREKATHKTLELPLSKYNPASGNVEPRGCELSFRLCLMPHIDREYSKKLYDAYVKNFWLDNVVIAGFTEWPGGKKQTPDIDSGPIVQGLGTAATGLGTGAVIAHGDSARLARLLFQIGSLKQLRVMLPKGANLNGIVLDDKHLTGFLFGDAMLFYCITWTPWIKEPAKKAGKEKDLQGEKAGEVSNVGKQN